MILKTIKQWMDELGYELCEGCNYESVYPSRSLLGFGKAREILIDALQAKTIRKRSELYEGELG